MHVCIASSFVREIVRFENGMVPTVQISEHNLKQLIEFFHFESCQAVEAAFEKTVRGILNALQKLKSLIGQCHHGNAAIGFRCEGRNKTIGLHAVDDLRDCGQFCHGVQRNIGHTTQPLFLKDCQNTPCRHIAVHDFKSPLHFLRVKSIDSCNPVKRPVRTVEFRSERRFPIGRGCHGDVKPGGDMPITRFETYSSILAEQSYLHARAIAFSQISLNCTGQWRIDMVIKRVDAMILHRESMRFAPSEIDPDRTPAPMIPLWLR
jgi:hypothetical protein